MGAASSTAASNAAVCSASRLLLGRKRARPDAGFDDDADIEPARHDDDVQVFERRHRRRPKRRRFSPSPPSFLDVPVDCLANVAAHLPLHDRTRLAGTCRTLRRCEDEVEAFIASREERLRAIVQEAGEWIRHGGRRRGGGVTPASSSLGEEDDGDDDDGDESDDDEDQEGGSDGATGSTTGGRARAFLASLRRSHRLHDAARSLRYCAPLLSLLTELDTPWGTDGLFRLARLTAPLDTQFVDDDDDDDDDHHAIPVSEGEFRRRNHGARHVGRIARRWLPYCYRAEEYAIEAYGWIERPEWDEVGAEELLGEVLEGQLPGPLKRVLRQELEAAFVLHLLGRCATPYLWRFFTEGFRCRYRYLRRFYAIL